MATAVLIVVLFWGAVLAVACAANGITPLEFLFGRYEPVAEDLGTWKTVDYDGPGELLREERYLLPAGRANAPYLLHQVRYRQAATGDIVAVEPERRVRRRRVSVRS